MANKKFSAFTAQAPHPTNSFLVGYDSALNDNIRFQEGDLNLGDMGGLLDLSSQVTGQLDLTSNSSGTIDLSTQVSGFLDLSTNTSGSVDGASQISGIVPEANGGTGVTAIQDNQAVGRKGAFHRPWDSGFFNVPRGALYGLPYSGAPGPMTAISQNTASAFQTNTLTSIPAVSVNLIPGAPYIGSVYVNSVPNQVSLWEIKLRVAFYDVTGDLDIQAGVFIATNTAFTGATNYLIVKDSANEASDSRIFEASIFYEIPATPTSLSYFILPWVRFDNGVADPYPYYDAAYANAQNEIILQSIY